MPLAMMDILASSIKEGILVALIKQQENPKAYCRTTLEEVVVHL